MLKISVKADGAWVERDSPSVFHRQHLGNGAARLRLFLPRADGAGRLHHSRAEFDSDAAALLRAFDWRLSPLQPSGIQEA